MSAMQRLLSISTVALLGLIFSQTSSASFAGDQIEQCYRIESSNLACSGSYLGAYGTFESSFTSGGKGFEYAILNEDMWVNLIWQMFDYDIQDFVRLEGVTSFPDWQLELRELDWKNPNDTYSDIIGFNLVSFTDRGGNPLTGLSAELVDAHTVRLTYNPQGGLGELGEIYPDIDVPAQAHIQFALAPIPEPHSAVYMLAGLVILGVLAGIRRRGT